MEPRREPDWFKRAVFYEVLVRGFADSDGDGRVGEAEIVPALARYFTVPE